MWSKTLWAIAVRLDEVKVRAEGATPITNIDPSGGGVPKVGAVSETVSNF